MIPATIGLIGIIFMLQPIGGMIGHDYYHAIPRLFIGALHFWKNPLAVPHYTAHLCGGIPYFADPQSAYFSLPQFLSLFSDPFNASIFAILISYIVGYWGFQKLGEEFKLRADIANLGWLFFLFNGFLFANLFVGHLTHHSFALAPWWIFLLVRPGLKSAIWLTLFVTYLFHAGGFHVLVVFAAMSLVMFPFLVGKHRSARQLGTFWKMLGGTFTLLLFTISGKAVASWLYSRHFYVRQIDSSSEPILEQLVRYFWFNPFAEPRELPFGGMTFGAWEYVGFLSRLTLPLGLVAIYFVIRSRAKRPILIGSAAVVVFVALLALGRGGNQFLPFLRSYHNPLKLLGAFILPMTLLATFGLDVIYRRCGWIKLPGRTRGLIFGLFATILLCEFGVNASYFVKNKVGLSFPNLPELYQLLKNNPVPPVSRVIDKVGYDFLAPTSGYSNLRCYEPLLGYRWEKMRSQVSVGETGLVRDGQFNLNHPGCLLYPDYFSCHPWDRIPEGQREAFSKFISADAGAFGVPAWQNSLLAVNALSVVVLLLTLIVKRRRLP